MSEKIRVVHSAKPEKPAKNSIRIDRVGSGLEYELVEITPAGDVVVHSSTKPIILSMARQWLSKEADK